MLPKRIILTIAVLVISITSFSKTFSYKHFSVEDGLPSSEVYDAIQDNDGFMWFATDRGVTRFDGYEFETFTTEDGLVDNVIFHLDIDKQGRVWCIGLLGQISYFEKGKFQEYEYNEILTQKKTNGVIVISFHLDKDNCVHIGYKYSGGISIDNNGNVNHDTLKDYANTIDIRNNDLHYYSNASRDLRHPNHGKILLIDQQSKTVFNLKDFDSTYVKIYSATIDPKTEILYFSLGKQLYQLSDHKLQKVLQMDNEIISVNCIGDEIWVGSFQSGFISYQGSSTIRDKKLENHSVTSFFLDKEDGVWVTTLEDGIFYFNKNDHYTLNHSDGLFSDYVYNLTGNDHELIIGNNVGKLSFFKIDKSGHHFSHNYLNSGSALNIMVNQFHKGYIFNGENDRWGRIYNGKIQYDSTQNRTHLLQLSRNSALFRFYGLPYGYGIVHKDETSPLLNTYRKTFNTINRYHLTHENRIIISHISGIYEVIRTDTASRTIYLGDQHNLFQTRAVETTDLNGFDFIAATRGEGVLFVKDNIPYALKKEHGLLSNEITSIFVDSSQTIWIGSSLGINIIRKNKEIITLRKKDGLISNEVTDIFVNSHNAYIGTKKGITILDLAKLESKTFDIPMIIKSIFTENQDLISDHQMIEIPYREPILNIKFVGLSYQSIGEIEYRYRLNEFENWQYTKNNQLTFTNLASGEYNLEIQASNDNKNWSTEPARLHIQVAYPFWRTNWFIILSTFGLSFILFGIYRFALTRIKKREEIKRQVQNLRFEALNAQMNPHFIFNSLNSVQHFIMTNDKRESTRYLSKFAKLMRKTLDHSREKNVSLHEELEALELYLELEALRFDNLITYQIEVDKKINTSRVILPALLIQPIVENAILHGIRPNANGGHISISILSKNSMLYISIIDNGIGREAALLNKGKGHNSKGGILTKERVSLFAKEYNSDATYEIIDLMEDDKSLGTEVRIKLPLILNVNK